MFSKRNSKTKVMVAIIICIVMLSMVFLSACDNKSSDDGAIQEPAEASAGFDKPAGSIARTSMASAGDEKFDTFSARASVTEDVSLRNIPDSDISFIEVEGASDFSFSPPASGWWYIYTTDSYDSDPYLTISDSNDNIIAENDDGGFGLNALMMAQLSAEEDYTIGVRFYNDGVCTLNISQTNPHSEYTGTIAWGQDVVFSNGIVINGSGDIVITERTELEFTVGGTSGYRFLTYNSGNCDPYLELYDSDGNRLAYADDNLGGMNALLPIFLEEGKSYMIRVGFWDADGQWTEEGETTLFLCECDIFPGEGAGGSYTWSDYSYMFTFVPNQTGTWVIRTTDSGDSDPLIKIFDRYGYLIAEDDDGVGLDGYITINLSEGVPYLIRVSFWEAPESTTTLEITKQ